MHGQPTCKNLYATCPLSPFFPAGAMRLPLTKKQVEEKDRKFIHYLTDHYGLREFKLKATPFSNSDQDAFYNFYGESTKIRGKQSSLISTHCTACMSLGGRELQSGWDSSRWKCLVLHVATCLHSTWRIQRWFHVAVKFKLLLLPCVMLIEVCGNVLGGKHHNSEMLTLGASTHLCHSRTLHCSCQS